MARIILIHFLPSASDLQPLCTLQISGGTDHWSSDITGPASNVRPRTDGSWTIVLHDVTGCVWSVCGNQGFLFLSGLQRPSLVQRELARSDQNGC